MTLREPVTELRTRPEKSRCRFAIRVADSEGACWSKANTTPG